MAISGKKLSVDVNGTTLLGVVSWRARETGDELDGASAATGGYDNPEMGLQGCTVEIRGWFDILTGDYLPIRRGTTLTNLELFRDIDDVTPAFLFASALVTQSDQGAENRGRFEINATVKAKGSYTYDEPGV
jgi:hypothetical protein